jgi:hypothetical protein
MNNISGQYLLKIWAKGSLFLLQPICGLKKPSPAETQTGHFNCKLNFHQLIQLSSFEVKESHIFLGLC